MKKIFALLALTSLLTSSAFAGDFLAKLTKGALSDTSPGVKELSLEEMKEVRGGAFQSVGNCLSGTNSCLSLAVSQTITGTHYRDFKAILTNEEPHSTNYHIGFVAQKIGLYLVLENLIVFLHTLPSFSIELLGQCINKAVKY